MCRRSGPGCERWSSRLTWKDVEDNVVHLEDMLRGACSHVDNRRLRQMEFLAAYKLKNLCDCVGSVGKGHYCPTTTTRSLRKSRDQPGLPSVPVEDVQFPLTGSFSHGHEGHFTRVQPVTGNDLAAVRIYRVVLELREEITGFPIGRLEQVEAGQFGQSYALPAERVAIGGPPTVVRVGAVSRRKNGHW